MSTQGIKRYGSGFQVELIHVLTVPDFNAGIGLVQMMGTTNYLALVGGGKSPKFAMNKVR
jgi:hypothetical protein